jgi:phytoene dehydrogenase-like protein
VVHACLRNRYRVSTAAYLTSLLQERIVQELELARFGYQVDAKDPAFFSAFPDGRHFFMWQDRAKTLAEIAKFSRRDAEVYPAYEDQLERLSQVVERPAIDHAAAVPAARHRFHGLPEARRNEREAMELFWDQHPATSNTSARKVKIGCASAGLMHTLLRRPSVSLGRL